MREIRKRAANANFNIVMNATDAETKTNVLHNKFNDFLNEKKELCEEEEYEEED